MAKQHSAAFLRIVDDARSRIRECSVHDLKAKMDAGTHPIVIDVREESEFAAGHLPGSVHLGRGILERDIESRFPDHDAELYLICGGGFRSALAADSLRTMGYQNPISVDGGWRGWIDAGYPVESPSV
jgi:rhodanese-related sulfurtransferase